VQKTADDIHLVITNLTNDGGREVKRRHLPEPWHRAYEDILAPLEPDLVTVSEFTFSQTRVGAPRAERMAANRRFKAAQSVLNSHGFRAEKGQGRNSTGMLVRKGSFILDPEPQRHYTKVYRTPPTHVVLHLPEVPHVPINVVSHHAPYCNPPQQLIEAYELTSVVDKVKAHHGHNPAQEWAATWLFGDWNQARWRTTPGIPWNSRDVTDVVHRCHRARKESRGPHGLWVSDTAVDELMMDCGMHDAARFAALHCGQPDALDPTAGFAPSARGQGGLCAIDRAYLDGWSIQAVKSVRVLDMTGISDHHFVLIVLSRSMLIEALLREFASLEPWALAT
jgi:hypothetical protein